MTNFYTGIEVGKPPPPDEGIPGYLKSLEAENVALRDKVAKLETWQEEVLTWMAFIKERAIDNCVFISETPDDVCICFGHQIHRAAQALIDRAEKEKKNG